MRLDIDLQEVFNAVSATEGGPYQERYRALRAAAPDLAMWFAPGSESFQAIGENPGDKPVKVIDTRLKDLVVHKLETRTLFIGWLQDDLHRQDGIYGHEHREKIRIVSISHINPSSWTNVFESEEWISRDDRFKARTPDIEKAKIKISGEDGRVSNISLVSEQGDTVHSFGPINRFYDIDKPFTDFDGIGGDRTEARLRNEL